MHAPQTTTSEQYTVDDALETMQREATFGSLDTGRYTCDYMIWGSGPPLLFVHGLGDDFLSFLLPMMGLRNRFRCIAYNQPQGIEDGASLREYTHDDLVLDLRALLDHLEIEECIIFGSSFGSTITLKALHQMPDRFCKGILQGGFAYRPLARGEWWLAWAARYFPGKMKSLPVRRPAMLKMHNEAFASHADDAWEFFVEQSGKPRMRSVARWALVLHDTDVRSLLPEIQQPVLLLCGDQDPLVPFRCQKELFNGLPNSAIFKITGCGHFPMFSHPEAMVHALGQFVGCGEQCS